MNCVCKHCGGTGWLGRYEQCYWCDGTGRGVERIERVQRSSPSTLGEQIKKAQREVESWTPERRAGVRLQGCDPYLDRAAKEGNDHD